MFDWLEFDEKKLKEQRRQIDSLQKRLADAISTQETIREKPVYALPTEEEIQEFSKIPIPEQGRDAIEVEEELMKYVFSSKR